jgi:hypothetical protein
LRFNKLFSLGSSSGFTESLFGRIPGLSGALGGKPSFSALVDVVVQTTFCFWSFHLQCHLFSDALALVAGPFDFLTTPFILAQNEL